jgi:hypothetical protein
MTLTSMLALVATAFGRARPKNPSVTDEDFARLQRAHTSLLHMFAQEQSMRLQLECDLIEAQARLEALRSNIHRAQAPQHLPLPAPSEALEQLMRFRPPLAQAALMPVFCNCAPGRHEAMASHVIEFEGDDTLF